MGPLAAKGFHTNQIHRISVYSIAFIILPLSWLSSSGLVSPSIVYSIVVMLLINFLLVGIERFIVNALFLLLNMALISLYRFYPDIFKTMTDQEQFLDWIINVPIVFAFIALLLIIFERAYEKERIINLKKTEKLEVISRTDPLTGLLNRLNLENDIDVFLREFRGKGTVFSMIIMDVDFFKEYNDTYGHQMGDDCLRRIGLILKNSIHRINDMAYRFGGEEFLLILSGTDLEGAVEFAQNLQKEIGSAEIPHKSSKIAPVLTVSMGISVSEERDTKGAELLKQADRALYKAKETGRDRIVCFE